ncbi:MAG: hypothetical protein ABI574_07335 [Burkholderiales bacterium]
MFKLFRSTPPKAAPPRRRQGDRAEPALRPTPSNWETVRAPEASFDKTLSNPAMAWLENLAPQVRPQQLAQRFPRIVNRFAQVWPDAELTQRYFDSLMLDDRGTRKGFPPEVMEELIVLRACCSTLAPAPRTSVGLAMASIDFS